MNTRDEFRLSDFLDFMRNRKVLDTLITKTLGEAVKEWLIDLRLERKSPKTIQYYRDNIRPLVRHLGGTLQVNQIAPAQLKSYLYDSDDGEHAWAHGARYKTLRAFLNWCVGQEYLSASPLKVKSPKMPDPVLPIFSQEQVQAMMDSCRGNLRIRNRAIIMTFLDTGLRLEELCSMKVVDLNIEASIVTVWGKGSKQRVIRIGDTTLRAIWQYLRWRGSASDYVWLTEEKTPMKLSGIKSLVRRLCQAAGVDGKSGPHRFRHTFACMFLLNGGQESELQYLLGHTTLAMTMRYTRAVKQIRALQAMGQFSPVEGMRLR